MFRFTIRELVLLTLVVAMGVGWWLDREHLWEQVESSRRELQTYRLEQMKKRVEQVLTETYPRPEPPESVLRQTPLSLD